MSFSTPDLDKFWRVDPFREPVEIETDLSTRNSDAGFEIKITAKNPAERDKWALNCHLGRDSSLSHTLSLGGMTLQKSHPEPFLREPAKSPTEVPVAPVAFNVRARPELFEHLPEGSQLRITKTIYVPTFTSGQSYYALLAARGVVGCRLLLDGDSRVRSLNPGDVLKLERPSTDTEWSLSLFGTRNGHYRVWHWDVSGMPGVIALECKKKNENFFDGRWEGNGLETQAVNTVLQEFAEVVGGGEKRYPPYALPAPVPEDSSTDRSWFGYKNYVSDWDPRRVWLNYLPMNSSFELKSGPMWLTPGQTKIELTKPGAPVTCSLAWAPGDATKLRLLKRLRAVSLGEPLSYEGNFSLRAGDAKITASCRKTEESPISVKEIEEALLPAFKLSLPEATPMAQRPAAIAGEYEVVNRYRDLAGKVNARFELAFRDKVNLPGDSSTLSLRNGCTLKFAPTKKDHEIGTDETITVAVWNYRRAVEQVDSVSIHGTFEATAEKVLPAVAGTLTCVVPSAFVADADLTLDGEQEFVRSLRTASEAAGSLVVLREARAD